LTKKLQQFTGKFGGVLGCQADEFAVNNNMTLSIVPKTKAVSTGSNLPIYIAPVDGESSVAN